MRSAAADCLPCLLECARGRGSEFRAQLWNAMLPAYKEAIEAEHDKDVLADQMHGIAQASNSSFQLIELVQRCCRLYRYQLRRICWEG